MSGLKKVGETAMRQTVQKVVQKTALTGEARAVTAAEAPSIAGAKESTTTSLMPWKGWFSRVLKEKVLGEERYQAMRKLIFYRPDDIHDMHQIPIPSTKVYYSEKDPTLYRQFRNPSPGSEDPVRIPSLEDGEDPYNVTYYTRDTARRYEDPAMRNIEIEMMKLELLPDSTEGLEERKEAVARPPSSPGNSGRFATGPTDFDTTGGTRATMSTNHDAMNKLLDEHMPDHLPCPVWYSRQEEEMKWYTDRDLPVPMGVTGFGTVPISRRVARW